MNLRSKSTQTRVSTLGVTACLWYWKPEDQLICWDQQRSTYVHGVERRGTNLCPWETLSWQKRSRPGISWEGAPGKRGVGFHGSHAKFMFQEGDEVSWQMQLRRLQTPVIPALGLGTETRCWKSTCWVLVYGVGGASETFIYTRYLNSAGF